MVHGRIEAAPAEQLKALREARDRYAALADQLQKNTEPLKHPEIKLAQEQNARRIAGAYDKSIANSITRMSSVGQTHQITWPSFGARTWLAIFMMISAFEGALLLPYFRPSIFPIRLTALRSAVHGVDRVTTLPRVDAPIPRAPPQSPRLVPMKEIPHPPVPSGPPSIASAPTRSVGRQVPPPIAISPKLRMRPKPQLQIAIAPEPSARPEVPQPGGIFPKAQLQTDVPASPAMAPKPSAQPQVPPLIGMIPRTSSQAATPAPPQVPSPVQPSTRLEPIAQTHSLPPYPIAAKANGEQGATQMRVTISIQGGATDCEIIQTSGSVLLDQAACRHVLDHWRWKPPTRDGQPVTATSTVNVVWNLKSAR